MKGISSSDRITILEKVNCFYDELRKKYENKKYNEQEYERLCAAFQSPAEIKTEHIEDALAWKYGKTRDNLRKNPKYIHVIKLFDGGWEGFVEGGARSGDKVFDYWNQKTKSSFISVAFIAHLIDPQTIPIVDQHTFRAVRYFLGLVGYKQNVRKTPKSLSEIYVLREFVHYFSSAKDVTPREFDKYLMMFGKHVAPR